MSNSVVPFSPNTPIPAYLLAQDSVLADAMSSSIFAAAGPKISIKAGRFRLVENGVEEVLQTFALEVVIVGLASVLRKTYFEGDYVEGENTSPACTSNDGVQPDAGVTAPQSTLCATCPKNAWGSKIMNGKDLKACSDRLSVAVLSSDDVSEGVMYELDIPPGSLGNFREYVKQLRSRKLGLEKVITVMSFDANASAPRLMFGLGGFLSMEDMQAATARALSDETKEVTRQNFLPRPAPVAALAAPAQVIPIQPARTSAPAPVAAVQQPVASAPQVQEVIPAAPAPAPAPAARGFGKKKGATAPAPAAQPAVQAQATPAASVAAPTGSQELDLASLEQELASLGMAAG